MNEGTLYVPHEKGTPLPSSTINSTTPPLNINTDSTHYSHIAQHLTVYDWDPGHNHTSLFSVTRGHVTSFYETESYDFAFEKRLVGHILGKITVIWFSPAPFSGKE